MHDSERPFFPFMLLFLLSFCLGCQSQTEGLFQSNQIGFYPEAEKIIICPDIEADSFFLFDEKKEIVLKGKLSQAGFWKESGEYVKKINLSEWQKDGKYRLKLDNKLATWDIEIKNQVHRELLKSVIKAFYFQRASIKLDSMYAYPWDRDVAHPDTAVKIHKNAIFSGKRDGTVDARGGWYDAGDYGKYTTNTGISVAWLLYSFEHYPELFVNLALDIPENRNSIPDILDEAVWGITWMLRMQDQTDGGVYHKLSSLNHSPIVMPVKDTAARYVIGKSTPAALHLTAIGAMAYRIFLPYDSAFARQCLKSAWKSWQWAQRFPDEKPANPSDVHTGEYQDQNFDNERIWASTELFISTGKWEDGFALPLHMEFSEDPNWRDPKAIPLMSLLFHQKAPPNVNLTEDLERPFLHYVNRFRNEALQNPYGISMGQSQYDFIIGSNSKAADMGAMLIFANSVTGKSEYAQVAHSNLDYLLGRNPTAYCFVSAWGRRSPQNIHHRPSAADEVHEPVPGLLVGGPQNGLLNCLEPKYPATTYKDVFCSWATNEVAINWNAPLIYLLAGVEVQNSP